MPERPLNERIYRVLVAATIALWLMVLVNIPSAVFNAGWILDALFGVGPSPAD
jgi:hypothetical protein